MKTKDKAVSSDCGSEASVAGVINNEVPNVTKFQIKNRFTAEAMFECELTAEYAAESYSLRLGFAVKAAIKARANLAGANLARANLAGANLAGANLADAYLARANLADANLAGANLAGANLADAYLARANLAGAYLAGANLAGANLADANLAGANLAGAYLARANLAGANLAGAYLAGAYLARANLAGANLAARNLTNEQIASANTKPAAPEEIARLDQVREIILKKPGRLTMDSWHSSQWDPSHTPEEEHSCGSAHCIAGWLQALSPDQSLREIDAQTAGAKLAPCAAHMFFTSDAVALQWFKDRAYAGLNATDATMTTTAAQNAASVETETAVSPREA